MKSTQRRKEVKIISQVACVTLMKCLVFMREENDMGLAFERFGWHFVGRIRQMLWRYEANGLARKSRQIPLRKKSVGRGRRGSSQGVSSKGMR